MGVLAPRDEAPFGVLARRLQPVRTICSCITVLLISLAATGPSQDIVTSAPVIAYDQSRGGGVFGPSVAIDPGFEYYRKHPLADIARDIRNHGFTSARVIYTHKPPTHEMRPMTDALRGAGVAPVLCVFPPTDFDLYTSHPEWRQKMLGNPDGKYDWRGYLCPNRPEFVSAYSQRVAEMVRDGGFDGVQLAEIWFEQWGGPRDQDQPRAGYACVCDACTRKFRELTGVDARDMLTSPANPAYFEKPRNKTLYDKWVDFRVQTIQDFGRSIIAAVKQASPKAVINVMFLSDARVRPGGSREFQANDLDRMVAEFKPDILTIQDAWQDWQQAGLGAGFIADYARAYRDRIRKLKPDTFIMTHADIGSSPSSKRSFEWIQQFARTTVDNGLGAPTFYEWSVSTMAE